jgi:aminopeptidase N
MMVAGILKAQVSLRADDLVTLPDAERDSHAGKHLRKATETGSYYDVKWYRCFWNIDPSVREISGNVTTLFTALQPGIDSVAFDLSVAMTVDSVIYHHARVNWYHVMDVLSIALPVTLSQDMSDSVTVYYHGIPLTGNGSFIQDYHNENPGIWTFSEPYGASDWWPCKNGLTDKADSVDIYIRTTSGNRAASNGILVSENQNAGHVICHWKHRYPIAAYLVAIAVTNYARFDQSIVFEGKTLPMVNYVYPEDSASAVSETAILPSIVQLFDSLFGIYPFQLEKYGHAEWNVGGGMENQTITFLNSFGFEIMAHELAHQWYGDAVTCGSWTDIWLNEGFATYLSGLCYEFLAPEYWTRFREVRVKNIISKPGGSVYCPDTTDVSRIFDGRLSYAKGAMILHQLRWIYGDSIFFTAMNDYLHDPDLNYGFVRNSDFKSQYEEVCGENLTWYFNDWYTGEGYPSYKVNWMQEEDTVRITVSQTQSHPSVEYFQLPLQLELKNEFNDTLITLYNRFSGQEYNLNIPFTVDSVIFDPYYQIISGNNLVSGTQVRQPSFRIKVFPDPVDDHLIFSAGDQNGFRNGEIRILDLSGRLVQALITPSGSKEITISTFSFQTGIYIYRYLTRDFQCHGKFIVLH